MKLSPRSWLLPVLVALAGVLLFACGPASPSGQNPPQPRVADCDKVDTKLRGLVTASDPAEYSWQQGLDYRDGKVLVIVELDGPNQTLPTNYDFDTQLRQDALVQGFLKLGQMCDLAANSQVRRIRAPARPLPIG